MEKCCRNCSYFPCARHECDIKSYNVDCKYFKSVVEHVTEIISKERVNKNNE